MFPNLPTDHVYKFLCIAGAILVVLTDVAIYDLHKDRLKQTETYFKEVGIHLTTVDEDRRNDRVYDSLEVKVRQAVWDSHKLTFQGQLGSIDRRIDKFREIGYIGMGMFTLFLILWGRHQARLDLITINESVKASRQYTECQSCSINLQVTEIKAGKIYCCRCHNGYSFIEPDLTLDEMETRVKTKMESDRCGKKATEKQVKKIGLLYRWNAEFKWD